MQVLAFTPRQPMEYNWQTSVSEVGYYWCRATDDDDIPENVCGPFLVSKVEQTSSFVFAPFEDNWMLANNGRWLWSKADV